MTYKALSRYDLEPHEHDPRRERMRRQRDLALGYRLLGSQRWGDMGDGHISARDPERTDCFWMLRYGVSFHRATISDLVLVDAGGAVADGDGEALITAYHIHEPLHQARPDVISATHTHTQWGTPFSAQRRLVGPITQEACMFFNDQALFDDEEVQVLGIEGGRRIARALGGRRIVLLANHGHLAVGSSVAESVAAFIAFERVAEAALKVPDAKPISDSAAQIAQDDLLQPGAFWHMFQWLLRRHVPDPGAVDA